MVLLAATSVPVGAGIELTGATGLWGLAMTRAAREERRRAPDMMTISRWENNQAKR